tara:strand:- start:480 stop:1310 length:831 start_codon:yes stop_codon:yes gene_type:complete
LRLLFPFAKRFIAGISTNDSSVVFKNHLDQNFKVIANLVGENIQSAEKIETICETYAELLDRFSDSDFSISLKLSSIGLDHEYKSTMENLTKLVQSASINKQMIRLDMEDSKYTDQTIEVCKSIHNDYPGSIGITLQANLNRTERDLEDLKRNGISIRLVKGAYFENDQIAITDMNQIRQRFLEYSQLLIADSNVKHSIATHDEPILNSISLNSEMKNHRFEFLYGVRRDLQRRFINSNEVGLYMPFGEEWVSYTYRRLKEFKNIRFVAKNLIKEK